MKLALTWAVALLVGGLAWADPPKSELEKAKMTRARLDMKALTMACQAYKVRYDEYPEKLEQLLKPPNGKPYIESEKSLLDPWGKKYEYDTAGKKNDGNKPDIWTVMPDKKEIGNWPEK